MGNGAGGAVGVERFARADGSNPWTGRTYGPLACLMRYLARFVILSEMELVVVAAWVMAARFVDLWDRFPHLAITSPEKRCGKSRLMELLEQVCPKAWYLLNVTAAALYRKIEVSQPTVLYDEAQSLNRGKESENNAAVNELFCGSISKHGTVCRCVGKEHTPTDFSIYCPKAIALIGKLWGALPDRCLLIDMKRKTETEHTERSRMRIIEEDGHKLAASLDTLAANEQTRARIATAYDSLALLPTSNYRMAELVLPLQAVLTTLFGDGEENKPLQLLREYLSHLERAEYDPANQTYGVQLLMEIRGLLALGNPLTQRPWVVLSGKVIASHLLREEGQEPWSSYNHGRPISYQGVGALLHRFGVTSGRPYDDDGVQKSGYSAQQLEDAIRRYLPSAPPTPPA
jgi:hypothetical protein